MTRILRRRLALTVALAAVLAGGTAVALGATTSPRHTRGTRQTRVGARGERRAGIVQTAASYLGLTPAQLNEQLGQGRSLAQVAAATPAKSEAGLVAAIVESIKAKVPSAPPSLETRVRAIVNRTPRIELARHAALGAHRHGALRAAALAYLGMTRHELITQLKTGKTLAQVADATPGKSAAGLTDALLATVKGRLDARVAAHELDKSRESARLTALRSRIARVLVRTHVGRRAAHSETGTSASSAAGA
jgi:hypothetical protein